MKAGASRTRSAAVGLALVLLALGCAESRNLGSSVPHGFLPVDERNPILLANDGATDNWQGEYAILLANGGGPKLAGIIVNTSGPWPNLDTNIAGWRGLVAAATRERAARHPRPAIQHRTSAHPAGERSDRGHRRQPVGRARR